MDRPPPPTHDAACAYKVEQRQFIADNPTVNIGDIYYVGNEPCTCRWGERMNEYAERWVVGSGR